MKSVPVFCVLSLMLLYTDVHPVLAKTPTTVKILFTSLRDGNREIYIMNSDGSEQVNLTQNPADDLQAIWAPTGEQILFASDRDGVRDLYLMDPDGSNLERVLKKEIYRESPTWSPDSKQIAYVHINWNLLDFTIHIATLGEQESEDFAIDASDPAWSPDGSQIACSVGGRIVFVNVRTRAQKRFLSRKATRWQFHPSWSGAGDKLAFVWNNNPLPPDHAPGKPLPEDWVNKQTIYIANHDGTRLKLLVDEAGPKAQYPALSPDGDEILYTQEANGFPQIFKLDVNSGIRTQLTHIGWNFGGDWFDPAYALSVTPQPNFLTTIWGQLKTE